MRRPLLFTVCSIMAVGSVLMTTQAGETLARKALTQLSSFTTTGKTVTAETEATDFGRSLLETWQRAGVELPMPAERIKTLRKGVSRLSATPDVELPDNMRFTGFLQYSNVDGKIRLPYGLYTFSQSSGLNRSIEHEVEASINGGGFYTGNRLCGMSNTQIPVGNDPDYSWYYYVWDTDTWQLTDEPVRNAFDMMASGGVDTDPVSGKIYGITTGDSGPTNLVVLDPETLTQTEVGDLYPEVSHAAAFAIGNDGVGYVLDRNGMFCKVDLQQAKATAIGRIDFEFYAALQSMTFDRRTGKLYLAASEGDFETGEMYGRLCEVNLEDATTKLVGYFPESEEYTVLHVVYDPEADAPADITDLTAEYSDATSDAVISFTVPSATFSGNMLTGDVSYSIFVGDADKAVVTGNAAPGEQVQVSVTPEQGRTKYIVVLSNTAGEGRRNAIASWGGEDTPAVTSVTADADSNGNVTLSWQTGGANGGYADMKGISYTIYRFPGPTVIAENFEGTSYTDNISTELYSGFVYNIVPVREWRYFQGMKSVPVYGGTARELPYKQDFESEEAAYDFMLLNSDPKGWELAPDWGTGGVLWHNSSPYHDGDSWALTPAFRFEDGSTYKITFKIGRISEYNNEILSVAVGEGTDTDNYQTLLDNYAVQSVFFYDHDNISLVYECRKSGDYHVGLHALSPRNQSSLIIDDLSIEQGLSLNVPKAVSNLSVTPGAGGELVATVSFTTPVSTVGGAELGSLDKVTVYREGTDEPVVTLNDAKPGEEYVVADEDAMNGRLTYRVTAWNESGEGESTSAEVYVGIDLPQAPGNITMHDNLDGTVTLGWKASATGVNGGLVDLDEVTYTIYYLEDETLKPLMTDIEDTVCTVGGIPQTGRQGFMFLFVTATNDMGESKASECPVITTGEAYKVPFMEGFRELEGIWRPEGEDVNWNLYSGMSADGDNYLMGARANDYNVRGALRSGKFSVKGVANPKIAFSFYGVPGTDNRIILSLCREGGAPEQLIDIHFASMEGPEGWRMCLADLSSVADAEYFNLLFEVEFNDEEEDRLYIDDINVRNVPEHNLSAVVIPQNRTTAGEETRIDVQLHNVGTSVESAYKVEVYVDGDYFTTLDAVEMMPFDRAQLSCIYPVAVLSSDKLDVKTVLVDSSDSIAEDNESTGSIMVTAPLYESPATLEAEDNNGATLLEWQAPEDPELVTESFEGYESFIYDDFGDWKVVDGDGMATMPVINNYYPGTGGQAAFFTVDFASLGYDMDRNPELSGHTGTAYVACTRPQTLQNDDWLISPELNGEAQTITFYAKTFGAVMDETVEVRYSTTGNGVDDFSETITELTLSTDWEEVMIELPEGARYFALHCISFYGGLTMVDDVTYRAAGREVIGYNIYRDNNLLATVDASTLNYTDTTATDDAVYRITAVYATAESAPGNEARVSEVENIISNISHVAVSEGTLTVSNANGQLISVVSIDGKVIYHAKVADVMSLPLSHGVYVITIGEKSIKVMVD
ncbi:MAG: choice-of-anchor J domain-containing protein [Muribaculaceae bacterium]|nr:choice-of-anchor J domain-containing protein [Muribaculaceae bacterium]